MSRTERDYAEETAEQTLVITRVLDAPRGLVFKAWTEPWRVMRWWGPKAYICRACRIDLRPGGTYLNCIYSPEGGDFWSKGVYREVAEPERIVFTDTFADEKGNMVAPRDYGMSEDWPAEALVEVTFAEQDGKTGLTLHHFPIKPGMECEMCQQGWNESLDKLADYLSAAISAE